MKTATQNKHIGLGFTAALVIAGLMVELVASGALVTSRTLNTSRILATANLSVYSDSACTQSLTSVNWGTISPGSSVTKTIYIKNVGSHLVELNLSNANWNPTAANGSITISWNREGTTLAANQVLSTTLTLSESSSATGFTTFSVDALITGKIQCGCTQDSP